MKKHAKIALAAVLAAGFAASVYLGPYWTLYRMKAAIDAKDAQALSQRVDFPALRQNVKKEFTTLMDRQMDAVGAQMQAAGASSADVASWRKLIPATAMFGPVVDRLVTPEGVAAMLSGGARLDGDEAGAAQTAGQAKADGKPLDLRLAYRSLNEAVFVVKDSPNEGFVFRRAGLWDWKLSGVDLLLNAGR